MDSKEHIAVIGAGLMGQREHLRDAVAHQPPSMMNCSPVV